MENISLMICPLQFRRPEKSALAPNVLPLLYLPHHGLPETVHNSQLLVNSCHLPPWWSPTQQAHTFLTSSRPYASRSAAGRPLRTTYSKNFSFQFPIRAVVALYHESSLLFCLRNRSRTNTDCVENVLWFGKMIPAWTASRCYTWKSSGGLIQPFSVRILRLRGGSASNAIKYIKDRSAFGWPSRIEMHRFYQKHPASFSKVYNNW